jgi:polysaccharide pyruvyl transferase WcaK-like protein
MSSNSEIRILFCGCGYGAGNIGDDAILVGLVDSFRKTIDGAQFGAITFSNYDAVEFSHVDKIWNNSFLDRMRAVRWATHIVLGGGTLLTDSVNLLFPLKYCEHITDLALMFNRNISMLAAGVSDIITPKAKRIIKNKLVKYCDVIAVRSNHDLIKLSRGLNISKESFVVSADAAFALPIEPIQIKLKRNIGINFVHEGRVDKIFSDRIIQVFRDFKNSENFSYTPLGLCSEVRTESNYDYNLIKEILSCSFDSYSIQNDYIDYLSFCEVMKGCDVVITMRMHILVFCALMKIPCLSIVREGKMENMLKELNLPSLLSINSSASDLLMEFRRLVESPDLFVVSDDRLNVLKRRALANASIWEEKSKKIKRGKLVQLVALINILSYILVSFFKKYRRRILKYFSVKH